MPSDIFTKFKEYSIAEFFKKNRQMLGFSGKVRTLTTIVHEYVTNSLDACEEHGLLPEIKIELKELENGNIKIKIQDNGMGIPEKLIGKALGQMLAGTKFARYAQQRGQQGIGASGCTMYALLTTGRPIYVESRYDKVLMKCTLTIDFKSNAPILNNIVKEENINGTGLYIEAEFGEVRYDASVYGVYEYLKRTALANPHAQITLIEPNGNNVLFPRSDDKVPPKPKDILPHPLGITTHDLIDFAKREENITISSLLQQSFSRLSANKMQEIKALAQWLDFGKKSKNLTWEEADKLVHIFKQIKWVAPTTDSIIPIGKEQIEKAMKNILMPEFVAITERSPKVFRGGIPFLVEVAIAYGGNSGKLNSDGKRAGDIMRFANRVPLLFDSGGCALTEAVKNLDWKRYGIKNFDENPITVLINFVSVHVPYTGAGKQAVAQDEEILDEIKNAVQEAAREMQRYVGSVVRRREREGKKKAVLRYVEQLSKDLTELSCKESENIAEELKINGLKTKELKIEELRKRLIEIVERKYNSESKEEDREEGGEERREEIEIKREADGGASEKT
ncbi:MAG: DNA topoisomerase VI subunit B [Candidatus Micrarchaeota archaeon]